MSWTPVTPVRPTTIVSVFAIPVATTSISTKILGSQLGSQITQHRPSVFDLTLVERQVIARSHFVGYVVRLSAGTNADISYHGARGHIVAFKQDPSELLNTKQQVKIRWCQVPLTPPSP